MPADGALVSPVIFRKRDSLSRGIGEVCDALKWGVTPLPAKVVALPLWVVVIVGQGMPASKGCVIIPDPWNKIVVRINGVGADVLI